MPTPSYITNKGIAWYQFDEGSGTVLEDSIGSHSGTLFNPVWITGAWEGGSAVDGNGVDTYADLTTLGSFGSSVRNGGASIAFTTAFTNASDNRQLMGVFFADDDTFVVVEINREDAGTVTFRQRGDDLDNTSAVSITTSVINDGDPHRIVINIDDVNVSIFVDGVLDVSGTSATSIPADLDENMFLFARNRSGPENFVDAILDDVIFLGDLLTAQDVEDDYVRQAWLSGTIPFTGDNAITFADSNDPAEGANVYAIDRSSGTVYSATTDSAGEAIIDGVPAGTHPTWAERDDGTGNTQTTQVILREVS